MKNLKYPTEDQEQSILIEWAKRSLGAYPELDLLYHIPNGGVRHIGTAIKLKKQGVKPGVCDLHLPVSRGGYHSLYIEMKRIKGGTLNDTQKQFIKAVTQEGNLAIVCKGSDQAIVTITAYLNNEYINKET